MTDYLLTAFATLFVTLDPIALAPLFIVITEGHSQPARRRIAILACAIAAGVLTGASLIGGPLIGFLGISIAAFRIAGGLLLFWIAFQMVFDVRKERTTTVVPDHPAAGAAIAAFPLAVPLMAGPASISATILLASEPGDALHLLGLNAVIVVTVLICFGVFLLSGPIERLLGATGGVVLSRLLGVILAALAVQFVADGVAALAAGTPASEPVSVAPAP